MSDFLSSIRSFARSSLIPVSTIVTLPTGDQYVLSVDGSREILVRHATAGFVTDDKPDLTVGAVFPFLFLGTFMLVFLFTTFFICDRLTGSMDVAAEKQLMQSLSITHVLNCCPCAPNLFPDDFVYKNLEMLDVPEYGLNNDLDEAFQYIEPAKDFGGRCLVHCNAGISRCTSIVIAYLICVQDMTFDVAFQKVAIACF